MICPAVSVKETINISTRFYSNTLITCSYRIYIVTLRLVFKVDNDLMTFWPLIVGSTGSTARSSSNTSIISVSI